MFKENEMPPLIGRSTGSNRYLRDKQPLAADIGDV